MPAAANQEPLIDEPHGEPSTANFALLRLFEEMFRFPSVPNILRLGMPEAPA